MAAGGLRQEEDGLQVDVDHRVPVVLGEVERIGAADDAGIVDEDVEAAERLRWSQSTIALTGSMRGEIGLDRMEAAPPRRFDQRLGLVHRRAADGDDRRRRPAASATAMRLADAGIGAGDDGDAAGKIEGIRHDAHLSIRNGERSMSVKSWLSPPIAQMKL